MTCMMNTHSQFLFHDPSFWSCFWLGWAKSPKRELLGIMEAGCLQAGMPSHSVKALNGCQSTAEVDHPLAAGQPPLSIHFPALLI